MLAVKRSGSSIGELFGECPAEQFDLGPFERTAQRRDDVDALAAGDHGKAFEAPFAEAVADVDGGLLGGCEVEALVGIDVEDDAVGVLELVDVAAPDVEFERRHLDAGGEAGGVVDVEIDVGVASGLGDLHLLEGVGEAAGIVLLEERLAGAGGAAQQRQRPVGHVAQRRLGHGVVVGDEHAPW